MVDTLSLEYENNKKSIILAYFLWFFLGMLGAHRFYFGKNISGLVLLILTVGSVALTVVLIGAVLIIIPLVWVLVDAFLIPGWTRAYNNLVLAAIKSSSVYLG